MAWSDPAKMPPVMVAVRAESAMAMLFIGGTNADAVAVMSLEVVVVGSAWSEVVVDVLAIGVC